MAVTKSKSQKTAAKPRKTAKNAKKRPAAARKKTSNPVGAAFGPGVPFEPTKEQRDLVILAKAMGYTNQRMCELITNPNNGGRPICRNTLETKFKPELANGRDLVMMKIAGTMITVAADKSHPKCITAGIYLSKVLGRWREPEPEWSEKKRLDAEVVDDGDLEIEATLVLEEPRLQLPPPDATLQ